MAPLHLMLTKNEVHMLREAFLQEVAEQAHSMRVGNDIVNRYTQYIVTGTTQTSGHASAACKWCKGG